MTEQTTLASELCPLVGGATLRPWRCSLISKPSLHPATHPNPHNYPSQKSPIFAQQLEEEEAEEPLGSRILVGYDSAHEG